jgi:hypothetical protein
MSSTPEQVDERKGRREDRDGAVHRSVIAATPLRAIQPTSAGETAEMQPQGRNQGAVLAWGRCRNLQARRPMVPGHPPDHRKAGTIRELRVHSNVSGTVQ